VAGDVAERVLVGDDLVVLADGDDDRALQLADEGMRSVDARVEDGHADALARRAAERPLTRDLLGPERRQRDPVDGVARKAPGGECLPGVIAVCGHVLHGTGLYGARAFESLPAQCSLRRSRISSRLRRSGS